MRQKALYTIISFLMAAGLLVAAPAFAQTTQGGWMGHRGMMHRSPGVVGTVSALSGTTLTVTGKTGPNSTSGATYTVDASNATVLKSGATSTVSTIAVGDTVMVQGTVNGTSVTATKVFDGVPQGKSGWGQSGTRPTSPQIQGNGQPVIGGNVAAINGTTLTVTNTSNVTYTVDATNATVIKGNATSSVSAIATGDDVIVQGTVNGSSVTASSIIDRGAPQTATSGSAAGMHGFGIFGAIGGFFRHLFGFF